MYYRFHYKKYKGSARATVMSFFGGLMKLFAGICFVTLISFYLRHESVKAENSMIIAVAGIVLLIIGLIMGRIADKIGQSDFEKKIRENLDFAISMVKENPEAKELYMQLNPQLSNYILMEGESLDMASATLRETSDKKSNFSARRLVVILILVIGIPLCIFFANGKTFSKNSSKFADENKYPDYVQLNNEVLWRIDASITPYVNQFGSEARVVIPEREISGITPVIDTFYSELDNIKELAQEKPKTDADESAIKLIDETKKMYDIINEVAKYYNDGQYKNDNLARAQEIHTKYINEINIWYADYLEFSDELDPMAIRVMSKDLDKFKKNGQDYEYYSLKLLIDSEAITSYMSDNNIDDTNVLSMELKNYKILLNTLNETYEQYNTYSENKSGSIHLEALKKDAANFVSSAGRIIKVVESQDLKAGIVHEEGIVYASDEPSPVEDLDYYLDRMISDYNSSISFDTN